MSDGTRPTASSVEDGVQTLLEPLGADLSALRPSAAPGASPRVLRLPAHTAPTIRVERPELPATDVRRPAWAGGTRRVTHSRAAQYVVKRTLDIVGAGVLLALLAPVMLGIGLAVRLSSPGPALYRSARLGLGGRRFRCLKFRTMQLGADQLQDDLECQNEAAGPIFKIADDPRVTRIGRFLRATALDELPQLLNILRGEMSLIGPRPLPLRDCERLDSHEHRRHSVLPGMSGLWQVSPERHGPDGAPIVKLDLDYVEGWSLGLDVRILARTLAVVVRGEADASHV